ncbi:MAG TPA: DUF2764 family protein [Paludibacter sp.]|nr:DUF2764 family protein [Paludibacter sp.]HOS45612.1 DUF2764 family protein [Paludibacter sp.]HPM09914.1 DUF2764 family protein [Paludibacter sp.]
MSKLLKSKSNYYYLVSGLPDLQKDDTKGFLSLQDLMIEIMPQLSTEDAQLLRLLYAAYDNRNFLILLQDKDAVIDDRGFLKSSDWEDLFQLLKEEDNPSDERLLPYFAKFYKQIKSEEDFLKGWSEEDYLSGLYYDHAMQSSNQFVSAWFEFNLNLNNLLTAIFCRKHQLPQEKLIVGSTEVAKILRSSHARDFGVANLFEYTEEVIKLAEDTDLLEREKKIDALKWDWLDEHTFFNYFSIERILAYVLRVEMLQRWRMLSVESGSQIFRELLLSMKEGIKINA